MQLGYYINYIKYILPSSVTQIHYKSLKILFNCSRSNALGDTGILRFEFKLGNDSKAGFICLYLLDSIGNPISTVDHAAPTLFVIMNVTSFSSIPYCSNSENWPKKHN